LYISYKLYDSYISFILGWSPAIGAREVAMERVAMSQARQTLPEIVNRVAFGGERVIINRSGKQVAAVVSMEDLAVLQMLEDREDLRDARAAVTEAKRKGTVSWKSVKKENGL
jgi:prevent-host-death family protein